MGILVGLNTSATNNLIMEFLVLFAVVASAAAQTLVTHPNGAVTPAQTPEVAAATAAHLAAKGLHHPYAYGFPYYNGAYGHYYGGYAGYPYYNHGALVSYPNGAVAPAQTPRLPLPPLPTSPPMALLLPPSLPSPTPLVTPMALLDSLPTPTAPLSPLSPPMLSLPAKNTCPTSKRTI